ncbi:MAG: zinc ribbon domain-containing protein [Desulfovibrionaceae bacterium]
MPIYEYRCRACGAEYEELVLDPQQSPDCPVCGKKDSERLLSGFANIGAESGPGASPARCGTGGLT